MKVIMPAQKDKIYYFREEERKKRIVPAENLSPVAQYDSDGRRWVKSPEKVGLDGKIKSPKIKSPMIKSQQIKSPQIKSQQIKSQPIKSPKVKSPISNSRDMSPAAALSLGMNIGIQKTESTRVNVGRPDTPEFERREYNLRSNSNVSIGSAGSGR